MPNPLLGPILRWFGKLSYPRLFLLAAVLFVADTLIPDFIPFADELLLGLGTLLLANFKKRNEPAESAKPPIEGDSERR
ncbi:MAG TPA: DUF6116 family protein [Lysobacter sp.]|jgi:hypothetical protein|nr:DUF6116 family protein [Lysobacter sp.]